MRIERLECPPEYQERLTHAGGLNRYEEPNFTLVWGQTFTIREGGIWDSGERYFEGYKDTIEDGRPCWIVKQWRAPECYGAPEFWYEQNRCPRSGLQLLADFPWRGRYETVQPLIWKGVVNGRLEIETLPLCGLICEMLVPMIKAWQVVETYRKELALKVMLECKERAANQKVEDAQRAAKLAFRGPVSFNRQGCRTSIIDKRMRAISNHWEQAVNQIRREGLGISIH